MDNNSGQGKGTAVPQEIKGLCWGGFFWNWLWGIFNRVWLSFLVFVPVVGFFFIFVLLFKGREWAWQNRTWESVEHFNKIQRRWTIAGLVVVGLAVLAIVAAILLPMFLVGNVQPPTPAVTMPTAPRPAVALPAKPVVQAPAAIPAKSAAESTTVSAPASPMPVVSGSAPTDAKAGKPSDAPLMVAPKAEVSAVRERPARARTAPRRPLAAPSPEPVHPEPKVYTPRYNDLMTAVLRPDTQGVVELLDLGRWVDKPDSNGTTPLQAAVRSRNPAMVELLVSRGANVSTSGPNGVTALDIARANNDAAMVSLLQRHGAR